MAVYLSTFAPAGKTIFATLQRLSDSFYWNQTAAAWQAAPALADMKIPLVEGVGRDLGSYTATVNGLGDAGAVLVRVHDDDDANDRTLGTDQIEVIGGRESLSLLKKLQDVTPGDEPVVVVVPTPSDPTLTTGIIRTYNINGEVQPQVTLRFTLLVAAGNDGKSYSGQRLLKSDDNGDLQATFLRGGQYKAQRGHGAEVFFTVPTESGSFLLPEVLSGDSS